MDVRWRGDGIVVLDYEADIGRDGLQELLKS